MTAIIVVVGAVGMFKIAPFGEVPVDRKGIWYGGIRRRPLGLVIAVTAPLGDLVESLIKRYLGVKDWATSSRPGGVPTDSTHCSSRCPPPSYVAVS